MRTKAVVAEEVAAVWVAIEKLTPWVKNPRKNDAAVDQVASSISRYGFGAPLLARRENGEVIAGHTRLKAAVKLGLKKIPVRYLDLDADAAHRLALADNKLGEVADWDDSLLASILVEMSTTEVGLIDTGFSEREFAVAMAAVEPPIVISTDEPSIPELAQQQWQVASGDVWEVRGRRTHRIVCGDSADPAVVAAAMGGKLADMMWTDPPYGVAYVGRTTDALVIENDRLSPGALFEFVTKIFVSADSILKMGGGIYVAAPSGPLHEVFLRALVQVGWQLKQRLVWVKDEFVLGHTDYHYRHEPILYACKPMKKGRHGRGHVGWFGDDAQTTVFEISRPRRSEEHPTMKPVELVAVMIKNSSPVGGIVFEPFSGSGTTMLAAEGTDRASRAIELNPKYVAVALGRLKVAGCEVNRLKQEAP